MTPAAAIASSAGGAASAAVDLVHLLPLGCSIDGPARRLASLIDPEFLAEAGWNPARLVFTPPPGHRLLGRPICRAAGCDTTAMGSNRICQSCTNRLTAHGLAEGQISLLPTRSVPVRGVGPCRVTGCGREWDASAVGLCRSHRDQQHALHLTVEQFLSHPPARPLPAAEDCMVASCPRQRRHPDGRYCQAHQLRVRARRSTPGFDETLWRLTDPPIGCGGLISLRGLPLLLVVQVVLGLQQRCRVDRVRTKEADLRAVVDDLRRRQVTCLDDYTPTAGANLAFNGVFHGLAGHARRALITPEREVLGDVWDLTVFGQSGTVSFTAITQPWLREVGSVGPLMICPDAGSGPIGGTGSGCRCGTTSGRWPGCRNRCGCGPTAGWCPLRWAARTWKPSCTDWRSRRRAGRSATTPGSGPAARSGPCSPESGQPG